MVAAPPPCQTPPLVLEAVTSWIPPPWHIAAILGGENITLTFQTFKLQEHIHVRACISSSCSVAILMSGLDVRISQILPCGP